MSIDDRLRQAARAADDSVRELPTADRLMDLTQRRRRHQSVRVAVSFAVLLALVAVLLITRPDAFRPIPSGDPVSASGATRGPAGSSGAASSPTRALSSRPNAEPTRTTASPPPDVVMHEVWRGGSEAHAHGVAHDQWAMTEFRATQPFIRSVEVNVGGPSTVSLVVYRHTGPDQWKQVVARTVPVQQDGHTKAIFSPAIPVTVGETLFLQVYNVEQAPLAVYFSDRDDAAGSSSYLWCPGPADSCVHPGHDMNAIVYGWARAS